MAAGAADPAEVFDSAARLYEQGRFREAAESYQRLRAEGVVTPSLLYNQGNAWYQEGRMGLAIACYRQAQHLAPRDREIALALERVRAQVVGAAPASMGFGERVMGWLTPNEWALLALGMAWISGVWLTLRQVSPRWRQGGDGAARLLAALAIGMIVVAFLTGRRDPEGLAIAVTEANAHFGPLEESQVAFSLPDGAELRVIDRKGEWLQVRDGAGRTGWIDSAQVVLPWQREDRRVLG